MQLYFDDSNNNDGLWNDAGNWWTSAGGSVDNNAYGGIPQSGDSCTMASQTTNQPTINCPVDLGDGVCDISLAVADVYPCGQINGGTFTGAIDVQVDSGGITGGIFTGPVMLGINTTVSGGTFTGAVTQSPYAEIGGGYFSGSNSSYWAETISGGYFTGSNVSIDNACYASTWVATTGTYMLGGQPFTGSGDAVPLGGYGWTWVIDGASYYNDIDTHNNLWNDAANWRVDNQGTVGAGYVPGLGGANQTNCSNSRQGGFNGQPIIRPGEVIDLGSCTTDLHVITVGSGSIVGATNVVNIPVPSGISPSNIVPPQYVLTGRSNYAGGSPGTLTLPDAAKVSLANGPYGVSGNGTTPALDLSNLTAANVAVGVTIGEVAGTFTHTTDYVAKATLVDVSHVDSNYAVYAGGPQGTLALASLESAAAAAQLMTDQAAVAAHAADIRYGTTVLATTGSCYVPAAGQVLAGVHVDATLGSRTDCPAADALTGMAYGDPATPIIGTLNVGSGGAGLTAQDMADALKLAPATGNPAPGSVMALLADKTGYSLAAGGLDAIPIAAPSGPAADFRGMVVQLWRRFFAKAVLDKTAQTLVTYADDATTPMTTQTATETATMETQGAAQ